jgi:ribosomal-protein-alanine N-acetyltransferase
VKDLVSERLRLRTPRMGDAAFIARLMNTSGYLENIGERGVLTARDAERYLATAPIYSRDKGLGFNLVELAETGEAIGICGLVHRDTYRYPDVGYAFLDDCAGKGFATEATARVVDHAFDDLRLPELLAITSDSNIASRRVLEKIGFKLSEAVHDNVCVYQLSARNALGRTPPTV